MFREGYNGIYDTQTVVQLQRNFEFLWQAIRDSHRDTLITKEDLAQRVLASHEQGLSFDCMTDSVFRELVLAERLKAQSGAVPSVSPCGGRWRRREAV
jgi:hypothetical protein